MSCEAEVNVRSKANNATNHGVSFGEVKPNITIKIIRANWVPNIHPRRLPKKGSAYRSSSGAQKNLSAYGSPTRLKNPIVFKSTPSTAIQA